MTAHSSDSSTASRSSGSPASTQKREVDAVVVGAGLAGLYMILRLRRMGLTVQCFERGSGVGGTWFWNRYPGARCDIESLEYSYQFDEELQQEWHWTERYSPQSEILDYINHVADRYDLRQDILFDTRVESAHFDEETSRWTLTTETGDTTSAQFCVMATGCLSSTNLPDFEGLSDFAGKWYHTGDWPHEGVDFHGKRVAVVGTGSSAIQSIPLIAEEAEHLTVFQRTPNYSVPANNSLLDPEEERRVKADYKAFRARNAQMPFGAFADVGRTGESALAVSEEEREQDYESWWEAGGLKFLLAYRDLLVSEDANATAAEFVRKKIHEIVSDPEIADKLTPNQVLGCKRLCADTNYFETYNQDHVELVDVSESPIERITPAGIQVGGHEYPADAIVFATGFDAMTGALLSIDIQGRAGQKLADAWSEGPRTYLGLATVGFPNLFTVSGPGSPSVLSNMIPSIEQHVEWISDCIGHLREQDLATIEPSPSAQEEWVEHVNAVAQVTLYPTCNSWYLGANVPDKPRVFMPYVGYPAYVEKCKEVVAKGYEGFLMNAAAGS